MVEMQFDADFVDVFQVRGVARQKHGQYFQPVVDEQAIAFYYRGLDGIMRTDTAFSMSPPPQQIQERAARWDLRLEPLKRVQNRAFGDALCGRPQIAGADLRYRSPTYASGAPTSRSWESSSTQLPDRQRCLRRAAANRHRRLSRLADSRRRSAHHRRRHSLVRHHLRARLHHRGLSVTLAESTAGGRHAARAGALPGQRI